VCHQFGPVSTAEDQLLSSKPDAAGLFRYDSGEIGEARVGWRGFVSHESRISQMLPQHMFGRNLRSRRGGRAVVRLYDVECRACRVAASPFHAGGDLLWR
jgi:hypothetical protein